MDYDFEPFQKIGPMLKGMTFPQIKSIYAENCAPFLRNQFSKHESLIVGDTAFIVYFSGDGLCEGAEFFAGKDHRILYRQADLMADTHGRLRQLLVNAGLAAEPSDYGLRCPEIGLATFHPDFGSSDHADPGDCPIDALYLSLDPDFAPG